MQLLPWLRRPFLSSAIVRTLSAVLLVLSVTGALAADSNDQFAARTAIHGSALVVTGNNTGATREANEPVLDAYATGASLWWTWTAPASGTATVTASVDPNFLVGVYTGATVGLLNPVFSSERFTLAPWRVVFHAEAGVAYQIVADGVLDRSGKFSFSLQLDEGPPNDMFTSREMLVGTHAMATGTFTAATVEPTEPAPYNWLGRRASVWWSWTAPAGARVIVSTAGSTGDPELRIYTGASLDGLALVPGFVAIGLDPDSYMFPVTAGETYQIAVNSTSGGGGAVTLELSVVTPPANDMYADRSPLAGAAVAVTASNLGAGMEASEPEYSGFAGRASTIWWTWTAPSAGTLHVSAAASAINAWVDVYTFDGRLERVGHGQNTSTPDIPAIVEVLPGTVLDLRAYGPSAEMGDITLQLTLYPHPANDRFADRTEMSGTATTVTGDSLGAFREPGEPSISFNTEYQASVWWTWTAPGTGVIDLSTAGSDFDTTLVVFTGTQVDALTGIVGNDDAGPTIRTSWLRLRVEGGVAYQLAVGDRHGIGGNIVLTLQFHPPPVNDHFADGTALSGDQATASGTTVGATAEVGERNHGGYLPTDTSIWWRWTPTASGTAAISVAGGSPYPDLAVYTGSSLASLVTVVDRPNTPPGSHFHVEAGTTYHIAVDMDDGLGGDVSLAITRANAPGNDMFVGREEIVGSDAQIGADNLQGTSEAGEPGFFLNQAARSLWWTWTPVAGGTAIITVDPETFVGVYTGADVAGLAQVASGTWVTPAIFQAVAGTTYQIAADRYDGGMVGFALRVVGPPVNDDFSTRPALVGIAASVAGTTIGATAQTGEPQHAYRDAVASVWWSWVAPANGRVTLTASASSFVPRIGVHTGASLAELRPLDPEAYLSSQLYTSYLQPVSRILFTAQAGVTYAIAVDGHPAGTMGEFSLDLTMHDVPANDHFANRTPLNGLIVTSTGNNIGASPQPSEPSAGWFAAESVWWSWTAPTSAPVAISTEGSSFDTTLGVFTGTNLEGLQMVTYNWDETDDVVTSRALFNAAAGATYQIAVDGSPWDTGSIVLNIEVGQELGVAIGSVAPAVAAGSAIILSATPTGLGPFSYVWSRDGQVIPDATSAMLSIPSGQHFHAGIYSVRIMNALSVGSSDDVVIAVTEPPPSGARLTNLSTRALDLTGDKVLIPGFVVQGPGTKKLLIRAVGPTLAARPFNLAGTLPNPRMALKRMDFSTNPPTYVDVAANDDWGTNANVAELITRSGELGAFNLVDGSADAALLVELEPGQYSVIADDPAQQTGIAIVELYDADDGTSSSRLINISNRGYVGAGDNIMIPGFVVSSEGPKTLLIRVIGPTLGSAPYNVPGVLADPTLSIYRHDFTNNTDELILTNDDWSIGPGATRTRDVAAQVLAFALPEGSKDAAFVVTLNPGVYSVHARGANDTTGVALVEVYAVP